MIRDLMLLPAALMLASPPQNMSPDDLRFSGACDGSAGAVLTDGRITVADDESSLLHVYDAAGGAGENRSMARFLGFKPGEKDEPDIEGAARIGDRIYWMGSHSRNKNGKPRPDRSVLFATTSGAELSPIGTPARDVLTTLMSLADQRGPDGRPTPLAKSIDSLQLAALAAKPIGPEAGGINIEAIAAGPGGSLLIGFRSPQGTPSSGTRKAPALLIQLLNPADVVDRRIKPRFGPPIMLDLAGSGIRDMVHRRDGSYVIVAGPVEDLDGFSLYAWTGSIREAPAPLPGKIDGLRPEAVLERNGALLLLSDDGTDACKAAAEQGRKFAGRWLP